jgi:hypothetical protein
LIANGVECTISPQIIREYLVVFTRGVSTDDGACSIEIPFYVAGFGEIRQ